MGKLLLLTTKKELEIYMNPNRQAILREMGRAGEPVTPKFLSDRLGISPSSVQFHLKKLEELGIVSVNHTEQIRGITARFFCINDVDVSIGAHLEDNREEREILLENIVHNVFEGCRKALRTLRGKTIESIEEADGDIPGDIMTGISFLTDEEAAQLRKQVQDYLAVHSKKRPGTHPWEYGLLAYKMTQEEGADE